MKKHALVWAPGAKPDKIICKETLNHRVPIDNAPLPTPEGETASHPSLPYYYSSQGVYDTVMRHTYSCKKPEDVWNLDMDTIHYNDLMTPVPHSCRADDIIVKQQITGDTGLYYPMLYTTLFM